MDAQAESDLVDAEGSARGPRAFPVTSLPSEVDVTPPVAKAGLLAHPDPIT